MYDPTSHNRSMARMYLRDLAEYHAGDIARFERMVDGRGSKYATASPEGWCKHVVSFASRLPESERTAIYQQLLTWGYAVPTVETGE